MSKSSPLRRFLTAGVVCLEKKDDLLEEETHPWYKSDEWYHVRIGEFFQAKYQVLGKLGFGSVSTAWLCRDIQLVSPFQLQQIDAKI